MTALVLSAGGMFAAWEAGVWKAICGRFQPQLIVGASAGAWSGWAIAGGATPDDLIRDWLNPETGRIMQFGLHPLGILRPTLLYQRSREMFARFQPRIPFALTLVEVPSLRSVIVRGPEVTWQHLAATCSIPLCFPPVAIDGRNYVDGGLTAALPLWAAAELGATRVVALNCLVTLPTRLLHMVLPSPRPKAPLEVIRIEPSRQLGSLREAAMWSRANVLRWIEMGEQDGTRAATSITL